jgi:lysophospholipase L1-like esterase
MDLRAKPFPNLLVLLLSLIFCIGITEVGMRFLLKNSLSITEDERNLTYRYDEELGWFPVENSKKRYTGSRSIEVEHNSRGFRDSERKVGTKPSIIFLGDSFVWGYDVEKQERFTEKLSEKLAGWSLYNLGVSGYGTDQEYLLLRRHYDFYNPNIVFLVFCTHNDEVDNSHNVTYGRYYKPYFMVNGDSLTLKGVPVPKSENYFFVRHKILSRSYWFRLLARAYFMYIVALPPSLELNNPTAAIITNMNEFVKARGAEFLFGLTEKDPELEKFLKNKDIPYVDLSNSYRYSSHGDHWTPDGHTFVSERIYDFLMEGKYLQKFESRR